MAGGCPLTQVGIDFVNSTSTTATGDSYVSGQGPELAADDDPLTWFGSATSGATATLELDVGSTGPYYDELANITVSHPCPGPPPGSRPIGSQPADPRPRLLPRRCSIGGGRSCLLYRTAHNQQACHAEHLLTSMAGLPFPPCRQDSCQDMLQCYGLDLYSEQNVFLEAQRFSGPNQTVYVLFFYTPPSPPRWGSLGGCGGGAW